MLAEGCQHLQKRTFSSRPPDDDGWIEVVETCAACGAVKSTRVRLSDVDGDHWQVWRKPWKDAA